MPIVISAPILPSLTFFGDSSSRDRTYMVAGGFAVRGTRIAEVNAAVDRIRASANMTSEFHWSEYRGGDRKDAYEALVRYAFDLVKERQAALHVIIAKFKGYQHKARPGDTKDTSVNRMYYQLLLHRVARFYGPHCAIRVRLDSGADCKDVCTLRGAICADAYKLYKARPNCVREIEPVCSSKSNIVQMADVVLGAIAAKRNSISYAKPSKAELAKLVQNLSGRDDWAVDTPKSARFLTVWNHQTKM
ncbi:uncharacterized protein DUF3800 [Sphingomonas sp. F9_3S_D5_B_2]